MKENLKNLALAPVNLPAFSEYFLGIKLSEKQTEWVNSSSKLVNILKSGNQFGKTTITAIKHIYHAMTKPKLARMNLDISGWLRTEYPTLNFGKTYEVSKAVFHTIIDIVNGDYIIHDPQTGKTTTNESKIREAVREVKENPLPYIRWWNNSITLIRSYDDLGTSFKMKKIAYISGDEIGDIPELILFINATLLPRLVFFQGTLDLVGTPQEPNEYQEVVELARKGNPDYFLMGGTMYDNPHLDPEYIKKIESVADPDLKRRMVYGEFVESGDRFFPLADIMNAFRWSATYNKETFFAEEPKREGKYVLSYDPAASNDNVAIGVVRYDEKPLKLVYKRLFKGNTVPLSMQYEMVREIYGKYKGIKANIKFIYDSGSLGGKNVGQQLRDLRGLGFPGKGKSYPDARAEALSKLKGYFEEGRQVRIVDGKEVDSVSDWGILVFPEDRELRLELEGYKLDDKKIRNDQVMMLAMAVWYIDKLIPRQRFKAAVDWDIYTTYRR